MEKHHGLEEKRQPGRCTSTEAWDEQRLDERVFDRHVSTASCDFEAR
jgi:hypothetical protein